jgi:uncharacterized protein (UPF0332 family)
VTKKSFTFTLVRKSERALKSARLGLTDGDYDGAVNRSYYAMFDMARATLLRTGVTEDKLPRTHNGVINAFRQQAVLTGLIDQQLGNELGRVESLRILADYTGKDIAPEEAADTVAKADLFVRTVERVFDLSESSLSKEYERKDSNHDDKVSEPVVAAAKIERQDVHLQQVSLEEQRRQARENWLRYRQQKLQDGNAASHEVVKEKAAEKDQRDSFDEGLGA